MNPLDYSVYWLDWIIEASWQLALLVVIVAAVCALARRHRPGCGMHCGCSYCSRWYCRRA